MNVRVTSLLTFEDCPRRFFAENILGLKVPSAAADIGTAIHTVAERWYKEGKNFPGFKKAAEDEIKKFPDTLNIENVIEIAGLAKKFISVYGEGGFDYQVIPEIRLQIPVGRHTVSGQMDALFMPLFPGMPAKIVDLKTGRNRAVTKQLAIYAFLVVKSFGGIHDVLVRYEWVRLNEKDEYHYSEKNLIEIELWINQQVKQIDKALRKGEEGFTCNPGHVCAYCGYAQQCPATSGDYNPPVEDSIEDLAELPTSPELLTSEMAEKYASRLLALQGKVKQIENVLKIWTEKHGPLLVGDQAMGKFEKAAQRQFDVKKVIERCQERGLNPLEYITLSSTAAKKLERKIDLEGCYTEKPSPPTWSIKKVETVGLESTVNTVKETVEILAEDEKAVPEQPTVSSLVKDFGVFLKGAEAPQEALENVRVAYRCSESGKYDETFWDALMSAVAWQGLQNEKAQEIAYMIQQIENVAQAG
ncbi:RecB family exonuclease [Heliorestis convoluta]|uniref:Edewey n=1 Tax=Heliorestis convoluta TaxID=356322 RepID=A0A5Q2MWH6_9FIRM|nr:PD-(D/E)XK nuclease family protein [Heliorestis convoluta]QGG46844.1 edewey [Heliorestis convoluta]